MEIDVKQYNNFFYVITILFIITHSLKAKRNPFCSSTKKVKKDKKPLILLATGCINNSSQAVATIKNGSTIGHYKLGDLLDTLVIVKIDRDFVDCEDTAGNKVKICP